MYQQQQQPEPPGSVAAGSLIIPMWQHTANPFNFPVGQPAHTPQRIHWGVALYGPSCRLGSEFASWLTALATLSRADSAEMRRVPWNVDALKAT